VIVGSVGPVYADQVFHTTRLNFVLTAGGAAAGYPQLMVGQVIDIHPSGPTNGAIEVYMINGAKPDTTYQVVLRIFDHCGGSFLMPITTAPLQANSVGFAQANFVYSENTLAGFEGATVGGLWTLVVGGSLTAYDTQCISITIG
jgi:hypothetical protein